MASYTYSDFDIELSKQSDGDVTKDTDLESIKNSISNILSTRRGSRRMMPEFGSSLEEVLFEPVDEITGNRIGKELIQAIELWDNRVDIIGVEVTVNHDSQLYDVNVEYSIKGFGSSQDTLRIILKRL